MRFGLFGTGPWAQLAHAPGLADHPEVELVGVWGRTEAKAAELAAAYGARAYPTVESLIDDVEAVAVALPPDVQAPLALQAARAGRHLFLDKPVAFTPEQADEISGALVERELASIVFFTRLFLSELSGFVDAATKTGGWVEARVDHVGSLAEEGNPFANSPWRHSAGGLWDVGPHAVALVVPVLGAVTEVTAMAGARDMTHVLLRHSSGAISTLTLSVDVPPAAAREEAVFAGESGIAVAPELPWEPVRAYRNALDQLLVAAGGGPRPELGVPFGAEVTAVLAAAAEAIRTGTTVTLQR